MNRLNSHLRRAVWLAAVACVAVAAADSLLDMEPNIGPSPQDSAPAAAPAEPKAS